MWLYLGGALWVLFLGRVVNGIAASSIGVAQAYIADITTPENRAKGMGLIGAAFGIGFVIGPAIGGTVGSIYRPLPFFISSGLALLNLVLGWFLLEESLTGELREQARNNLSRQIRTPIDLVERLWQALSRPALRLPLLIFFFFNVSFTAFEMALPLFTQKRYGYDSHQNGYLFAFVGVLVVIMQGGVIGLVVKKFGERRTLQVGLALVTLSLALVPVGSWLALLMLVLALIAVGEGISTPTSTALISLASRAEEQGEMMGISQGTSSLARIIGPLMGGIIFSSSGEVWPFIAASGLMGIALILALALKPVIKASEKALVTPGGKRAT